MRMHSGLFVACAASMAFAFSCADSSTGDDGMGSDDPPPPPAAVCGDGTCAATEVGFCSQDCGNGSNQNQPLCGDGTCDPSRGETSSSCAVDCGNGGGGSGSGSGSSGSTSCDPILCFLCLADATLCLPPDDQNTCATCLGLGSGGGFGDDSACDGGAPDGTCSTAESADPTTCVTDCLQ